MVDIGDAKSLVDSLTPSEGSSDYRWKVSVSVLLGVVIVIGGFHIAWACGLLAFAGLPGFASAEEVKLNGHELAVVEANQIDAQIMDTRTRQCKMMQVSPRNDDALTFYTQRLGERMSRYRQLVGQDYRLPDCNEL